MPSYLVIPGIRGDSEARSHEGAIEVTSWTFGVAQLPTSGAGSAARQGRPQFNAASFGCRGGPASPLLLEFCASGRLVDEAVFTQEPATGRAGSTEARFSDARIISYAVIGDDDLRRDDFQLSYARVTFTVRGQRPDDSLAEPVTTTQPPGEAPPVPTPGSGGVWRPRAPLLPRP